MAHMDAARRIGKHLKHIVFWACQIFLGFKGFGFSPKGLPFWFFDTVIVAFNGHGICPANNDGNVTVALPVLELPCKQRHDTGMTDVLQNYRQISRKIAAAAQSEGRGVALVAVSKTHDAPHILPVLAAGHRVFGENRVQEAKGKWPELRKQFPNIELHLIGPLQSNKAAEAVQIFDVIETIDRDKIAGAVAAEIRKQGKPVKLLVQVNTGNEPQKAGIPPEGTLAFLKHIGTAYGLKPEGLMCIPPVDQPPQKHFALLRSLANDAGLAILSMGMSEDYTVAIAEGATHVRVGSAIFGARAYPV
jgi:PLP dependent protein